MSKTELKQLFQRYWWIVALVLLLLIVVVILLTTGNDPWTESEGAGDTMTPEEIQQAEEQVAGDIFVPEQKGGYVNDKTYSYTDRNGNTYSIGVVLSGEDSANSFGLYLNPRVKSYTGDLIGLYLDSGKTGMLLYSDTNDFFNVNSPELKDETCTSIFRTYDQLDPVSFKSLDDYGVYWSDSGYVSQQGPSLLDMSGEFEYVSEDMSLFVDVRAIDLVTNQMQAIFRIDIGIVDGNYCITGISDSLETDPEIVGILTKQVTADLADGVASVSSVGATNEHSIYVHPVKATYFSEFASPEEILRSSNVVYADSLYAVTVNIGGSVGMATLYYDYSFDEEGAPAAYYCGHDFIKPFTSGSMIKPEK